jgi:hypothetical protein
MQMAIYKPYAQYASPADWLMSTPLRNSAAF